MKKITLILAILAITFTLTATANKGKKAPITEGVAMPIACVVTGSWNDTPDACKKMVDNGMPVVLVKGKGKAAKMYFVMNSDGSYATKQLKDKIGNKSVKVTGKVESKNGVMVIYADKID